MYMIRTPEVGRICGAARKGGYGATIAAPNPYARPGTKNGTYGTHETYACLMSPISLIRVLAFGHEQDKATQFYPLAWLAPVKPSKSICASLK